MLNSLAIKKIVLGTAQFGMDYGINNQTGQLSEKEAFAALDLAVKAGVEKIDTAPAYGSSEALIGSYLKMSGRDLKVISKTSSSLVSEVSDSIRKTLARLGQKQMYGCLVHDFKKFQNDPSVWNAIRSEKEKGRIQKIGFSLYYPDELAFLLEQTDGIDVVQVPYNVFDRRFEGYFGKLKDRSIEVQVRSVFLQGLVFKRPEELTGQFSEFKTKLAGLRAIAEGSGQAVVSICLNFCLNNDLIDGVVVGVDGSRQLEDILDVAGSPAAGADFSSKLSFLREDDEAVILPVNWETTSIGAK